MGFIMEKTAKLFMNGRSQAVRLPLSFRFDCDEVKIRKNPITGEVTLSAKPKNWDGFVSAANAANIPDDFMSDRGDMPPQERDLF